MIVPRFGMRVGDRQYLASSSFYSIGLLLLLLLLFIFIFIIVSIIIAAAIKIAAVATILEWKEKNRYKQIANRLDYTLPDNY